MRAVVYRGFQQPPAVEEVADPAPPPDGVVVRVEATGLCRSDWHGWQGHDDDIVAFPHIPGHEFAGVVAAVGGEVSGWREGDRVTAPFVYACGHCPECAVGEQQVCRAQVQPGFGLLGSFADYVVVANAATNLVRLPDTVDTTTGAALGCRFATAYRAIVAQGRAAAGEWAAIFGCGGVGLSAVMIAAASGLQVVAVDVSPAALELARSFGATTGILASDTIVTDVVEATRGGAHLTVDALGSAAVCATAISTLRRRGRHVQVGLLPDGANLPMSRVVAYELSITGSHGMAAHAYDPMLTLVATGRLRPDLLITRTVSLDEAPRALVGMSEGSPTGVTMIAPGGTAG
ncbi:zinc-dependent alcohol dehydrogenase family protein [Fodinicola acaciae]|uniref:zinc-dependent alcohol dehydrogenase family protein n=1 Tax=Fodinicola acaciae TaxID=2681555 RepID=UPI0013D4630C|nr:zinc-dependent alcohol dehydrogenase family protein [Fodinicola acaciae]